MAAFGVLVCTPDSQSVAGMAQRRKQAFVQQSVPQSSIETFYDGILGRLSGRDVMPVDLAIIGEGQNLVRDEPGPSAADHSPGIAVLGLLRVSNRLYSSRPKPLLAPG